VVARSLRQFETSALAISLLPLLSKINPVNLN
jgi:hypothetical protein